MQQAELRFHSVKQVHDFVNAINHFDTNFRFCSGTSVVNAKSILGVFTMDLSRPLLLQYDSDDQRIHALISPYRTV